MDFALGLQQTKNSKGKKSYIMYHGTSFQSALLILQNGFRQSQKGMLGPGVYVTRSFQKATAYPKTLQMGDVPVVLLVRVRVGKVKRIDKVGHRLQKTWHQAGYDTAWVPPNCGMVASGLEEDCVWDPRRIEVLDIMDRNGTSINLNPYGFMTGACGMLCPVPCPPMFEAPCYPAPGPPMYGCPYPAPMPGPSCLNWFP